VFRLFIVGLSQETQLVFHRPTTLVVTQTRLEETPQRLLQALVRLTGSSSDSSRVGPTPVRTARVRRVGFRQAVQPARPIDGR
jgi:hypothetical protein